MCMLVSVILLWFGIALGFLFGAWWAAAHSAARKLPDTDDLPEEDTASSAAE